MFYIVQMADFHFGGKNAGGETEKVLFSKMTERIIRDIPAGCEVVFCACGDYIDSKPLPSGTSVRPLNDNEINDRYTMAKEAIMASIIEPLQKNFSCKIGLCMGNHDTTHLDAVNRFSREIINQNIDKTYSIHLDSENVDLIFLNSCPPGDYTCGRIDYSDLERELKSLSPASAKYFILHHTIMSMDEIDSSSIRQAPQLIKLVDQYSVKAILHGHTHGQYLIRVGTTGCPIIGVGAVYVRDYPNVNSQFNIICCSGGTPIFSKNYQYHADVAMNPGCDGFQTYPVSISKETNYFYGNSFSKTYKELVERINAESKLYHVLIHINSSFESFCEDVISNFGKQIELKTYDKEYSYLDLAEMWEAREVDNEVLYFNHGMYYPSGVDYIIQELERKTTSSRAVLVTVNTQDILNSSPDALLPSLLSIQVGFDQGKNTLSVSMNLRALEASRFLKINICEILLIAQKIHERYPFSQIEIVLSAFRVQIKEGFGCFLKAKLDTDKQLYEITARLACLRLVKSKRRIANEIDPIINLIKDKQQRTETVIETIGIQNLSNVVKTTIDMLQDSDVKSELNDISSTIETLLKLLNQLKLQRERFSEQTDRMDSIEEQIQVQYNVLIDKFERLKEL